MSQYCNTHICCHVAILQYTYMLPCRNIAMHIYVAMSQYCNACCHVGIHVAMLQCMLLCCNTCYNACCHVVMYVATLQCMLPCCNACCHVAIHVAMLQYRIGVRDDLRAINSLRPSVYLCSTLISYIVFLA